MCLNDERLDPSYKAELQDSCQKHIGCQYSFDCYLRFRNTAGPFINKRSFWVVVASRDFWINIGQQVRLGRRQQATVTDYIASFGQYQVHSARSIEFVDLQAVWFPDCLPAQPFYKVLVAKLPYALRR